MSIPKILYKSYYWRTLQFLVSFLLNIYLVRILQAVIIAEFHSLTYLCSFVASFFMLGLDLGITYYITQKKISTQSARKMIVIITILSLFISLPILFYTNNKSLYNNISQQAIIIFAALYIAGNLFLNLSSAIYTAFNKNYYPVKVGVIFNCLTLITVLTINYFLVENRVNYILYIFFSLYFIQGIFTYLLTYKLNKDVEPHNSGEFNLWIKIVKFSFYSFIISLLFFLGLKINVLLLSRWINNYDLGNYTQTYKLIEYIITFIGFIAYPLIAILSEPQRENRKHITLFLLRISNTFILTGILLITIIGHWMFPLLFGNSFNKMYQIFLIFIPGIFATTSSIFFTSYYFATGKLKYNFISAILLLISAIFFLLLLATKFSIHGAAAAFSISSLISLMYDLFIFKKIYDLSFKEITLATKSDFAKIKQLVMTNFYAR